MAEPGGGEFQQASPTAEKQAPYVAGRPGRNFYDILGVKQAELDADPELLKRRYRELARQHHPESTYAKEHPPAPDDAERFKDIGEAYEVLSDPTGQKQWDYKNGYGRYEFTAHPDRPYVPPEDLVDVQDSTTANNASSDESPRTDPHTEPNLAEEGTSKMEEQWWRSFGEYDTFEFDEAFLDKSRKSGRSRTRRPHRKSEAQMRRLIDERAEREFNSAHEKIKRDFLNTNYSAYLSRWRELRHLYDDRKYFQKAKYGPFREQAAANVTTDLETAIINRLASDEHYSVEPKVYSLPDGTYLRVASYWGENDNGREDTTRIEHITGEKDDDGYYRSRGIEIVREGQSGDIWLRRITRPYKTPNMLMPLQFYFNIGFSGGGYIPVVSEGAIKNKELREYMAMLQQTTPRQQPVLV